MLAALSPIDDGILVLYLATLVAGGFFFASRQGDTTEFLLGGRRLPWPGLGLSLAAPLVAAIGLWHLPAAGYEQGVLTWIIPAALVLLVPVVVGLVIPLDRGLALGSVYEYLELRFSRGVRLTASLVYLGWRVVWLAGVLTVAAQAVVLASGWPIPVWFAVAVLGTAATLYTFLGGLRAVVWAGGLHSLAIAAGIAVIIVGIWLKTPGGPERVIEVAHGLGRDQLIETQFDVTNPWLLWGALPHWGLVALALFMTDQATIQRLAGARTVEQSRRAYVWGTLIASVVATGLLYAGVCLLTFYYDHPQHLRAEWVANVDSITRQPATDDQGRPLLDPRNPAHEISAVTIDQLIAERRLLRPNSREPFASSAGLIDPKTGQVIVEKLAQRRPPTPYQNGEWIVSTQAPAEMLPQFIAAHLPVGAAGLALVALVAAALAWLDTGLQGIATVIVIDLHRGCGWGKARLARKLNKPADQLTSQDELQIARPLMLVLGVLISGLAIGLALVPDVFGLASDVTAICAGPLLAIFLLGMLTRGATAPAVLVAMTLGIAVGIGLNVAGRFAAADQFIPKAYVFDEIWNLPLGVVFTLIAGYVLSFVLGRRKSNVELRGLVSGRGELGVRTQEDVHLDLPNEQSSERWK